MTSKLDHSAKRGMFCLLQQRHSYLSLKDGLHEYDRFVPGIVSSVKRDGTAQRVRIAGSSTDLRLDRRDWSYCYVDTRGEITDPAGMVAKLATKFGIATEFNTLAAAQAAIKQST